MSLLGFNEWMYIGPAVSMDVFGLFTEVGLTAGAGDYDSPQFMFQIGYAYHFH